MRLDHLLSKESPNRTLASSVSREEPATEDSQVDQPSGHCWVFKAGKRVRAEEAPTDRERGPRDPSRSVCGVGPLAQLVRALP